MSLPKPHTSSSKRSDGLIPLNIKRGSSQPRGLSSLAPLSALQPSGPQKSVGISSALDRILGGEDVGEDEFELDVAEGFEDDISGVKKGEYDKDRTREMEHEREERKRRGITKI
eukprot:TRINITY_DN10244_c2_g1_i1.p2 TRINITY_DN10244_c2_g1~~TRINITY_DN10244_c2_g1_i1.p2  ORF type:complete len:114 (+),score=32.92 TRINITY_DN10244_c2_g1_i1:125-466(+)